MVTDAEKDFLHSVGRNIAKLRKEQGYSQLDVCAKIQMEKSNLSSIENGRQNFTALTLKKIADAIDTEVSKFFIL
ncbi:helix-turn-helix domain-containing protein [Winogradskyella sediminis]|uniref:helix-turn-helix domain-containing protein n=1 Tax=Winogradskyella sediminis TaxID=1382466 RepID=UPI003AA8C314